MEFMPQATDNQWRALSKMETDLLDHTGCQEAMEKKKSLQSLCETAPNSEGKMKGPRTSHTEPG